MSREITEENRRLRAEYEAEEAELAEWKATHAVMAQVLKEANSAGKANPTLVLMATGTGENTEVRWASLGLQVLIVLELRRIATALEEGRDEST